MCVLNLLTFVYLIILYTVINNRQMWPSYYQQMYFSWCNINEPRFFTYPPGKNVLNETLHAINNVRQSYVPTIDTRHYILVD
jgi:hypothetical protein